MARPPVKGTPPPATDDPTADPLADMIDRRIGEIVPRGVRGEIVSRMTQMIYSETFSGPIAHPRHLREYEQISPGAADRIITMAEKSNAHHIDMQKTELANEASDRTLGMWLGAAVCVVLIGGAIAIALITRDRGLTGIVVGATAVASIGGLFVKGRNGK